MSNRLFKWTVLVLLLLVALLLVGVLSVSIGSVNIPISRIFTLLFEGGSSTEHTIIFDIRIPRIILGIVIGGALALAGVLLQGMFRNPLVEPYTLGISGGAALGVCLGIVFRLSNVSGFLLPVCGFLGAITVVFVAYTLSVKKGVMKIQGLLLIGVMISFISSSLVMLLMAISRSEDLHGIVFWIMGSLEEPNMYFIKLMSGVSLLGLFISYLFCSDLNALSLGEEEATHLGVNVERVKKILFLIASLLTGFSVSIAGVIGFVGLAIPHFVRLSMGSDHRVVLIGSYIIGGIFLVICDTLARTIISPLELPVGVITGIVGGSLFIYALYKSN